MGSASLAFGSAAQGSPADLLGREHAPVWEPLVYQGAERMGSQGAPAWEGTRLHITHLAAAWGLKKGSGLLGGKHQCKTLTAQLQGFYFN